MNRLRRISTLAVIGFGVLPYVAKAVPTVYTDETSYLAAITAINATAVFGLEDFNSSAVTAGSLDAGPHAYNGFSISLNGIGNNGSFNSITNPGLFDGSNAFASRLVHDSSDFVCCGGFTILGEGAESMDFAFTTAVIGFAADWSTTLTHDGVSISVNGTTVNLGDHLTGDGDGFVGVVDAALIGSMTWTPDDLSIDAGFEDFEFDDFQFATMGVSPPPPPPPPIPAPGALVLGMIGFGMLRTVKRWIV